MAKPAWCALPMGYVDVLTTDGVLQGWALDKDAPSTSISVHVYIDGSLVSGVSTTISRPDVNAKYGVTGNHGFNYQIPSNYLDGKSHTYNVYAINTPSGTNPELIYTPSRTFSIALTNAAQLVSQSVPSTMTAGQTYSVSVTVTMKNTGNSTWTKSSKYKLGSQNPQDNGNWGLGRVELTTGDSIAPGQQKTFTFNVIAPKTSGTYNFQWRMVQESVQWFGDYSLNGVVTVVQGSAAQFVSQSVPSTMTAGQTYSVSVTMKNTGNSTWTKSSNYKLGSQNPQDNGNWGLGRVELTTGDSIAPGQQKTFTFNVIAPKTSGTYNFQWRMVQESIQWFGDYSTNVALGVGSVQLMAKTLPGDGTITVKSNPPLARIWYKYNGSTDITKDWVDSMVTTDISASNMATGTYQVKLVLSGYADWISGIQKLSSNKSIDFSATLLRPMSASIKSTPSQAEIYYIYNGVGAWKKAGLKTPEIFENIPAGTYQIKLTREGYADWISDTKTLETGDALEFNATLPGWVNGDAQISAPLDGSDITIKTSSLYAGAISSLLWKGKEFVNTWDHGRQIQSAASFDNHGECFNPTEAGSANNGISGDSTSVLESITTTSNSLTTQTNMAFWLEPGQRSPSACLSGQTHAVNTSKLSNHKVKKKVTIGYLDMPNVVDYQVTFTVPESHMKAQMEVVTPYLTHEFSKFWAYDPGTRTLVALSDGPGEQTLPVILATTDGAYALGVYSPDLPVPYAPGAGYGRFRFNLSPNANATMKSNMVYRRGDTPAGDYTYRCFLIVGTVDQVKNAIQKMKDRGVLP